ncbi:MAG: uroporphyrinogen-III C-methyltransferase [Motiliproteus sp.]
MEKKSNKDDSPQPSAAKTETAASSSPETADSATDSATSPTDSAPTSPDKSATTTATDKAKAITTTEPDTAKAAKPGSTADKSTDKKETRNKAAQKNAGDTSSKTAETKPKPPASDTDTDTQKQGLSKLAIIALLLAIVALGVIGYGFTLIQKLQLQQAEQVSSLKEQLSDSSGINRQLQQQNGQILGELNQVRDNSKQQQGNLNELQNRLSLAMQQVSKLGTDSRKDWLLAEVEYLLRLANQRVLMERTASGALALLQSADKILQETDDVSIYPVRKALAQDILALQGVPSPDVEGMFIQLVAIDSQIDYLRLLPATDKHQLPELLKEITADSMSQSWQDGASMSWSQAVDKLGSLIVIRHRDEPIEPLMSPEQQYFLTQNLHLMLEQTQLALLQGKQQAFDTGLAKATSWIGTYFEATDPTTQALVISLGKLQGAQISPTLPDISGSLQQLKTYLSQLHNIEGGGQ